MKPRYPTKDEIRQVKVDQMIADLTDEDLVDLKPLALERIADPRERERLKGVPVRQNRWLRALVYDVLDELRTANR